MDKSTVSKPDPRRESSTGRLAHKGAVLQPSGLRWAFKGLGIAKRYCRRNSNGDSFVQAFLGWQYPMPTGAILGIDRHQTKAYALA